MYECLVSAHPGVSLSPYKLMQLGESCGWEPRVRSEPSSPLPWDGCYVDFTCDDESYDAIYDRMIELEIRLERRGGRVSSKKIKHIVYEKKERENG